MHLDHPVCGGYDYGVAMTIRRLHTILGLVCKRALHINVFLSIEIEQCREPTIRKDVALFVGTKQDDVKNICVFILYETMSFFQRDWAI